MKKSFCNCTGLLACMVMGSLALSTIASVQFRQGERQLLAS
ncbi:hypothetical protein ACO0LF_18715 [Undibacterium sp. Di27W]